MATRSDHTLEPLPGGPFDEAVVRVNEWRGRCMDAFARAEAAVVESLLGIGLGPAGTPARRLPHLVGQRFERLAASLAEAAPEGGGDAAAAAAALAAFRIHDRLRPFLCHGVASVALDRRARFVVVLRLWEGSGREFARGALTFDEREACDARDGLVRASRELCAALGRPHFAHACLGGSGPASRRTCRDSGTESQAGSSSRCT